MINRRDMLKSSALGFGHLAMTAMLQASPMPHIPARAKRVIFLFMHGGPSHVDTFDYKPKLFEDDGKPLPFDKPRVQFAKTGNLGRPRFDFHPYGQCGHMISDLFPKVGTHADALCMVKSVHGTNAAHGGALLKLHTGSDSLVRPSMGSWVSYGLGSENQNLPSFITMNPSGGHGGAANYASAFLPAQHQGTRISGEAGAGIPNVTGPVSEARQSHQLRLLRELNQSHAQRFPADPNLDARIRSFELAYRMQTEAPEVMDLEGESAATRALYGLDDPKTSEVGQRCLLARRLVERGVRFVQVSHGYWDQHSQLEAKHRELAHACDQPIAGLLTDLKQRGLLDDTLVWWGGEFGRTPTIQGKDGRDHNPHAFTMWFAGGGVKAGFSYGQTDDYGFYTVDEKMHVHDLHATILHLLGLDHEQLTYGYGGRDFRLTDVYGNVIEDILA
ncbi:MAG: hypothetical protein ACI9TH_004378 [Kiritimatiellia bacterium]|jgi:hypothetical protein